MTRFGILAIFFALLNTKATAQHDFKKVDEWLKNNTPEMGGRSVLMVYHNGSIIYSRAVNAMSTKQKFITRMIANRTGKTADLEDYSPSKRQAIASCSKWLSAALVMTFIDDGSLKLNDTAGKYLPVLTKHGKGSITISQCLSHLTGIKAPELRESLIEMNEINSMDEAIENIAAMPMEGKPGTVFHYSNAGLQIAGAIIEKLSGKSFEALFKERLAQPLKMKNTDFGNGKVALPAGGAYSSPEDYLNFLVMILNHGIFENNRILSEKSIALMQADQLLPSVMIGYKPEEAGNFGYGFGEWVMPAQSVSSPGLFGSFPWVDNKNHYAAFMMTFYLKNTGRNERYLQLKDLLDKAMIER